MVLVTASIVDVLGACCWDTECSACYRRDNNWTVVRLDIAPLRCAGIADGGRHCPLPLIGWWRWVRVDAGQCSETNRKPPQGSPTDAIQHTTAVHPTPQ
jgi:hypothetical protein